VPGRPRGGDGGPPPREQGALASASGPHQTAIVRGSMVLQGVYRFGDGRTIQVGENERGEGVVASTGRGAITVPGTSDLESVSCTTTSRCYAVGLATSDLDEAVLVTLTDGRPVSVTDLPAFIGLYGIACPSASTCYAVGYDNSGNAGAVTTITNGQASAPAEVPDDGYTPWLNAISCPTATQCYAAGLVNYEPSIVPITAGVPADADTVADAWYLNGIDCPAVGDCIATGENDAEQGIVATLVNGQPGSTRVVPGTSYLYGVGCAADGSCLLAGASPVSTHSFGTGVLVGDRAGTLTATRTVPGSEGLGQTVCGQAAGDCVSAGASFGR
jgi:hypothetical protein